MNCRFNFLTATEQNFMVQDLEVFLSLCLFEAIFICHYIEKGRQRIHRLHILNNNIPMFYDACVHLYIVLLT